MYRHLLLISGLLLAPLVVSAQTVTQPASMVEVSSADDYATMSFQDSWDMSERTDLGWFTYSVDMPFGTGPGGSPGFNNISFSGGIFSAVTATNDPALSVLDTGSPVTAQLGKIGTNYPIDADRYRVFSIRMKLDSNSVGQFFWSRNTIYVDNSASGGFPVYSGWAIYSVNIPALLVTAPFSAGNWTGTLDSLRFDPTAALAGENIEIDWIRLINDDATLNRTISWTGSSLVDIYLDDDTSSGNGNLGTIARSHSGTSFTFNVGSLAPGDYYVIVVNAGGNPSGGDYSSGFYRVNDIPTLEFTSPSEEGSSDEFATVQLNNAWDMDALTDIDYQVNHSGTSLVTVNSVEDEAGNDISPLNAFRGVSIASPGAGFGDPYVYPLWFVDSPTQAGRGQVYPIDSAKYRILVLNLGVPGNRDLVGGSVARIVWKRTVDSGENVSEDIVIRSMNPTLVMNKIITDMATLPRDSGFTPVDTGWNGLIDNFRVDAHEFSDAREYYIKDVKLAAFEKAGTSYVIRWNYSDSDSSSSDVLDLYYDNDRAGFNGVWIGQVLNPAGGQYTWNSPPNGTHYIYAVYDDGNGNTNRTYARWPIVIDSSYVEKPKLVLDKSQLNFNITSNRSLVTGSQQVRLFVDGSGSVNWTASVNPGRTWLHVSPTSGSGNDVLNVSVDLTAPPGAWDGTITVASSDASNAPRYVRVFGNVAGTSPPFGSFDVPANGTTDIAGAISVSGWVLDDIEVMSVQIFRDPVAGEGSSSIYIGDAVFVEGARPDVEQLYPAHPFHYRSGWGYMMLTNFLPPNQGNGTYVLHAYATDKEGRQTFLGSKTIHCDNLNAEKPFGTIDTPGQGGTVSGVYPNWGWVLTPQPNFMPVPPDPSTIGVYVDGVLLGNLDYGYDRPDIASAFPGYANSNSGVGVYNIDTTAYENGVHTLGWYAVDNGGRADGIGSRFFVVENPSPPDLASIDRESEVDVQDFPEALPRASRDRVSVADDNKGSLERFFAKTLDFVSFFSRRPASGSHLSAYRHEIGGLPHEEFGDAGEKHSRAYHPPPRQEKKISSPKSETSEPLVKLRRGFKPDAELIPLSPDEDGFIRIEMKELDRIEIHLPGVTSNGTYEGYHVVGNDMRRLPIGSSLDGQEGVFYWALPPGFLGEYQLLFRTKNQALSGKGTKVLVKVVPQFSAN